MAESHDFGTQCLRLRTPDLRQSRGNNTLLIWGDDPQWLVVDSELDELLAAFDGNTTTDRLLARKSEWQAQHAEVEQTLREVLKLGVLAPVDASPQPRAPIDHDAPLPIENLALNLTRCCNLRCRFCYNLPYLDSGKGELEAAEMTRFLESALPLVSKQVTITVLGGEPLLESAKLLELARWAHTHGISILVSSNGTRVTNEFARRAREARMEVQISLDGHTPELHDAIRGTGNFEKTRAGIQTLLRYKVHTILSMVCHAGNVDGLEDYLKLALKLGVAEARFIPLKRLGGQKENPLTPVPLSNLMRRTAELLQRKPDYLRLLGRDAFSILGTTSRMSTRRRSCGTGLQTIMLDADGSLYPCLNCNMPQFKLGSIRDPSFNFADFWKNDPKLHAHRRATAIENACDRCRACVVRYWCLGGCKGENYVNSGALNTSAVDCAQQRAAILEMLWILAEHPELIRTSAPRC